MSRYSGSADFSHTYWDEKSATVVSLDFRRTGHNSTLRATRQINKDCPSDICEINLIATKTRDVNFPTNPPIVEASGEEELQFRRDFSADISKAFIAFMDNWRNDHPHLANIRDVDQPGHDDLELFGLSIDKMCRALDTPETARSANAPTSRIGIAERVKSWITGR